MTEEQRTRLRQRISLEDYLTAQGWKPARRSGREEWAGLCPLHRETRPSFYVNRRKQVFYCHGCGRGGDLNRLVELLHGLSFPQALAHLGVASPVTGVLEAAFGFYQSQLACFAVARQYLARRGIRSPEVLARLRMGYAPGASVLGHLMGLGYAPAEVERCGLIDHLGRDRFWRRVTIPLPEAGNLYGRAIDAAQPRHRFLPRPKGGLYGFKQARQFSSLIVVEGLLDWAALWQAGIYNVVAALGSYLNPTQLEELGDRAARTVYLCLDADRNGSGACAARCVCQRLRAAGMDARRVELPLGQDPCSFFCCGGTAAAFQRYLEEARP